MTPPINYLHILWFLGIVSLGYKLMHEVAKGYMANKQNKHISEQDAKKKEHEKQMIKLRMTHELEILNNDKHHQLELKKLDKN
jgi:hypothetical protein